MSKRTGFDGVRATCKRCDVVATIHRGALGRPHRACRVRGEKSPARWERAS